MYEENEALEELNQIIDDAPPLVRLNNYYSEPILDRITALVASFNENVLDERQVLESEALQVAEISLSKNMLHPTREQVEFKVFRELSNFLEMAISGKPKDLALEYTDFLSPGHPLSTSPELAQLEEDEVAELRAQWLASDPAIAPELRPMIASALVSPEGSAEREYVVALLYDSENSKVLKDLALSLSDPK